ncbi:MAG: hypothetical protein KOO65_13760 [Desulfobacterales bacterium]|nr:hypothetical protein [Desulfobacterales bacterium]
MTALTEDKQIELQDGVEEDFPVAATEKIFAGAMACVNADGYCLEGSDTAGLIFQGIAMSQQDNTDGSDGDLRIVLRRRGLIKMILDTAITQANVGDNVFLVDDQTVDLTANVTHNIFCGIIAGYVDTTHAWIDIEPAIRQADVATHIADAAAAHAASAISGADAGGFTAETDVEAMLQELYPKAPVAIADPGASGAIPVTRSATVALTTAAGETRTIAIPALAGITLGISLDVDVGDATITVAAAINQTGNNTIVLGDAGDTIVLIAVHLAAALVWRVVVNDGCTLSTV